MDSWQGRTLLRSPSVLLREILGEKSAALGRGQDLAQQLQPPPDVRARQLPGPRLDVDIAAKPVEVKGQGILECLPTVAFQQFGAASRITLPSDQLLLQAPASLVDFTVRLSGQLVPNQIVKAADRVLFETAREQRRQRAVQAVVTVCDFLVLDREKQEILFLEPNGC